MSKQPTADEMLTGKPRKNKRRWKKPVIGEVSATKEQPPPKLNAAMTEFYEEGIKTDA